MSWLLRTMPAVADCALRRALRRGINTSGVFRVDEPDLDAAIGKTPQVSQRKALVRAYLEAAGLVAGDGTVLPRGFSRIERSVALRYPLATLFLALLMFCAAHAAFDVWFSRELVQEKSLMESYDNPHCPSEEEEEGASPI